MGKMFKIMIALYTHRGARTKLHFVAHPVDFLHVREHHFGIDPVIPDHALHIVRRQEVGNASISFSSFEGQFVVGSGVLVGSVNLGEIESVGKEVVDQSAKRHAVSPRTGEVGDFDILIISDSALTPNEDGFHLR